MNDHQLEDDPYFPSRPATRTSKRNNNAAYQVYTQELSGEADDDLSAATVVEPGNMNSYMDDYLRGAGTSSSSSSRPNNTQTAQQNQLSRQKADEDLATLLEETADMSDIQKAIEVERSEMAAKFREETTRQRRAAAARSRYQRMTENERKAYNQRRRAKSTNSELGELLATNPQMSHANAKKAEAARQRYHRMTPEQKREYNHRRTEAFRRRRMQEEALLATPAGQISSEALAKAQQIMVRNARKAQSARLRYQRMTPDERRAYNLRRAASKKKKIPLEDGSYFDDIDHGGVGDVMEDDVEHEDDEEAGVHEEMGMGDVTKPNHLHFDSNYLEMDEVASDEHLTGVINQVARPPKQLDVFAQMELDVLRRTKKAKNTIMKQYKNTNSFFENMTPEECYPVETPRKSRRKDAPLITSTSETFQIPNLEFLLNRTHQVEQGIENPHLAAPIPIQNGQVEADDQRIIDEQALHKMVETGYDATGMPVEVRTADGERITNVQDLLTRNVYHGQTVLITSRVEAKPAIFDPILHHHHHAPPSATTSSSSDDAACQDNQVGSTTSSHLDPLYGDHHHHHHHHDPMDADDYYHHHHQSRDEGKREVLRARRAERARARYHRMSEDQRREQNARRAATLRQARARDDELLKLGEKTPLEELDEETAKAIRDAQERRLRRAEQARNKYRRMTEQERRVYNSSRDAVRRMKKESDNQHLVYTQVSQDPQDEEEEEEEEEEPTTSSSPIDPDDASSFFYGMFPPKN